MKIKCIRGFVSSILTMVEGEEKEIELDSKTLENWVELGLVEKVESIDFKKEPADGVV